MLDQTTVIVGGDEIIIESLPATQALQLLTRTISIVGGLGKGIKDFPSSLTEARELGKELEKYIHLGDMLEGLISRLDSKEVPEFIKKIIKDSLPTFRDKPKSGDGSFDQWYENRFSRAIADQFNLLFEIYKWNYGDSFTWITGFFASAPQEKNPQPLAPGQPLQS